MISPLKPIATSLWDKRNNYGELSARDYPQLDILASEINENDIVRRQHRDEKMAALVGPDGGKDGGVGHVKTNTDLWSPIVEQWRKRSVKVNVRQELSDEAAELFETGSMYRPTQQKNQVSSLWGFFTWWKKRSVEMPERIILRRQEDDPTVEWLEPQEGAAQVHTVSESLWSPHSWLSWWW